MVTFLKNPTADAPWDEEEGAESVVHIEDQKVSNLPIKCPNSNFSTNQMLQ